MIVVRPEDGDPRRKPSATRKRPAGAATPELLELLQRQQDLERELREDLRLLREPRETDLEDIDTSDDLCQRVEQVWRELREVADALDTVEKGQYGICTDCGRRIPRARLRANPVAVRCRDCQSRWDGL